MGGSDARPRRPEWPRDMAPGSCGPSRTCGTGAIEDLRHRGLCRAESQASTNRRSLRVPRLYSDIDKTLEHVIRKALFAARGTGEDDLAQTEQALRAA